MESLIPVYGYPVLFIGSILEGETFVLIAGGLTQSGLLRAQWVILAAGLGAFCGDQFFFHLGRMGGMRFVGKHPSVEKRLADARLFLDKYRWIMVFGFRFVYGFRMVSPLLIGMSGFSPGRFMIINALSAASWAGIYGWIGIQFGGILTDFQIIFPSARVKGFALICLVLFLYIGFRRFIAASGS